MSLLSNRQHAIETRQTDHLLDLWLHIHHQQLDALKLQYALNLQKRSQSSCVNVFNQLKIKQQRATWPSFGHGLQQPRVFPRNEASDTKKHRGPIYQF
jgi:hypothetical protein